MIESKELRIGNLVGMKTTELKELIKNMELENIDNCFSVSSIDNVYTNCISNGLEFEVFSSDVEPIPLNEEWLVKFGFTEFYHKGLKGYISDKMELLYNLDSHQMYSYNEVNGSIWNLARCKHVHQLQNLYFALTGEELKIK